ncbi:MAG TPA: hypothetical protein VF609_15065 [Flavisolibacter sp.]
MNTKFFLLLLVSLMLTTSISSISATRKNESNTIAMTSFEYTEAVNSPVEFPLPEHPLNSHSPLAHEEKSPLQPEDGKHHHFHFHRFDTARRRDLKCLACKIILVIGHICCFLYCVLHAFHH